MYDVRIIDACMCEKIASTCGDNGNNEQCSPKIEYCGYRMRNGTVYGEDGDDGGDGKWWRGCRFLLLLLLLLLVLVI